MTKKIQDIRWASVDVDVYFITVMSDEDYFDDYSDYSEIECEVS